MGIWARTSFGPKWGLGRGHSFHTVWLARHALFSDVVLREIIL
jgi:hypothetical protein